MRRFMLGLAVAVAVAAPTVGKADDQQIAQFIKGRLKAEQQAGNLKGFNIDMRVDKGTIWFSGHVANQAQEDLVLQTAQQAGSMGAVQIVDDIEVRNTNSVFMPRPLEPMAVPATNPVSYQEPLPQGLPIENQAERYQAPAQLGTGLTQTSGQTGNGNPMPMPMAYSGGDAGMGGAPSMPGYAWPGYAANPNYAAVTYPKQYSPSAWPYIGPFYPYPQVPMGWRRVELEWDDGWWFLDFHDR